ncbi:MAG: hypothetical protein IJT79_07180 [Ruminococcus sp.]|nr:hypothetical protein [Ruminococcus sp.]
MKTFIKITAVVMALLLCCAAFASCGGDSKGGDSGSDSGNSVAGETQTWGNITVLVPDGMTLKGGSILDEKDPDVVNISKKDNATNYFLITINDTEDGAKSGLDSTKDANKDSKETTFEAGKKWTAVTYEYSGSPAFQAYAEFDGRYAVVQSFGFASDDDTTTAVISSLKVKAAE